MAENGTVVTEFVLLGFRLSQAQTGLFFECFCSSISSPWEATWGVMALIQSDPRLRTPHVLLPQPPHPSWTLLLLRCCPAAAGGLADRKRAIGFGAAPPQFFFFTLCASTGASFLAVMAHGRYVAVCGPLLYASAMTPCAPGAGGGAYGERRGQRRGPHRVRLLHLLLQVEPRGFLLL